MTAGPDQGRLEHLLGGLVPAAPGPARARHSCEETVLVLIGDLDSLAAQPLSVCQAALRQANLSQGAQSVWKSARLLLAHDLHRELLGGLQTAQSQVRFGEGLGGSRNAKRHTQAFKSAQSCQSERNRCLWPAWLWANARLTLIPATRVSRSMRS